MVDLTKSWVRFRTLPEDLLETMPDHVREAFLAARRDGFEVEMLCAGAKVPTERRSPRRLVLVADDLSEEEAGGPLHFDLDALAADVQAARRLFVISSTQDSGIYATAYGAAVEDLQQGFDASVIVETQPRFASAWVRTLAAIREGRALGMAGAMQNPVPGASAVRPARAHRH